MDQTDPLEWLEPRCLMSFIHLPLNSARIVRESEPNDDKASANAFVLHSPSGNARLKGTFKNSGDRDYFRFTAPRSGRMQVDVRGLGGTFAKLEIETQTDRDVFETEPDDGVNSGTFRVQSGQTYVVRIEKHRPGDHPRYLVRLKLRGGA